PFPIPRLIAKYYIGLLSEEEFIEKWKMFYPQDNSYLFFLVNKAILEKEHHKARVYLTELKKKTPKNEWNYFRALRIYNNILKM
ncbi:MAG: hypothetical protein N2053_12080, partial [Chitinispirillaceae bacterium]|nr:hypothetical protein [Chitinispirillaceae bacterium]